LIEEEEPAGHLNREDAEEKKDSLWKKAKTKEQRIEEQLPHDAKEPRGVVEEGRGLL
jgi:hypothetical protein